MSHTFSILSHYYFSGRKHGIVLGLLVSLASSGLKVGRTVVLPKWADSTTFSGQLFTDRSAPGDVGSEIKH